MTAFAYSFLGDKNYLQCLAYNQISFSFAVMRRGLETNLASLKWASLSNSYEQRQFILYLEIVFINWSTVTIIETQGCFIKYFLSYEHFDEEHIHHKSVADFLFQRSSRKKGIETSTRVTNNLHIFQFIQRTGIWTSFISFMVNEAQTFCQFSWGLSTFTQVCF